MSERVQLLKRELTVLASNATEQLQQLERMGLPKGVDELALDYDAIAAAADDMLGHGELNQEQRDCVMRLNEFFGSFSGQENADLWTPQALHSATQWEQVRRMASNCLALLR